MFLFFKPYLNFAKKTFLVIAVYFIVISLFSHFINKDKTQISPISQISPIEKNRKEIYKVINDKELGKTKEGKITIAFYRSFFWRIISEACIKNANDIEKNYQESMTGFFSKLIKTPFANPPASGIAWVSNSLQQAGFTPKAYAAEGIGFSAIKPFADIWKIFRDLSYMLLVIFLMAIGFMIMFRTKLNPQTVISVENALPKIVISLILITFSFAIAGFLIDLMYIITAIMISILTKNDVNHIPTAVFQNQYLLSSGWDIWLRDVRLGLPKSVNLSGLFTSALIKMLPAEADIALRTTAGGGLLLLTRSWVQPLVDAIGQSLNAISPGPGNVLGLFMYPVAYSVVYIPIFMWGFLHALEFILTALMFFSFALLTFRILALLFTSYLKLIILIILGPFLLLFESLGKSAFKYWLMNIIGNLIAFPITILIFLLGYLINTQANNIGLTGRLPYLYGIEASGFKFLIGLGLIFLIPDLVKLVKEALGIKDLPVQIGLGTFFGGVASGVGGGVGLLGQFGSVSLGLQAFGVKEGLPGLANKVKGIFSRSGQSNNPIVPDKP